MLHYKKVSRRQDCTMKNKRRHRKHVNVLGDFRPIFYFERFLKINFKMSSKNGKPMMVPTMDPTTPVDRARFVGKPRIFTASISTIWADTVFWLSSALDLSTNRK